MNNFHVNQIVKGHVCGVFVILGFRQDPAIFGDEVHAILKEVNPADHTQTAPGELALAISELRPLD